MTQTIKQFIDLGWYTVPLKGTLKRLSNGKKNSPLFEEGWNEKYAKERNEEAAKLGGVLTGKVSGIIAIDCDNSATCEIIRALDPSYDFVFESLGKKDGLGNDTKALTVIYNYVEELSESYKVHNNFVSLDFLSNNKFSYLPCEDNTTKASFDVQGKELKDPPATLIALLKSLKPVKIQAENAATLENKTWRNYLRPQIEQLVAKKKATKNLFRVLTPKDFRDLPEYIEHGYLDPDQVPDGRGSEYLSKVSAILGADESIDIELYIDAMKVINNLFSQPMKVSRLTATIVDPMVEETATINGKPIWQYDENWQADKLQVLSKRNQLFEVFYEPRRMSFFMTDVVAEQIHEFGRDIDLFNHLDTIAIDPPSKKESKTRMPLIDVVSDPSHNFGFFESNSGEQAFNKFVPSAALRVFKKPDIYKDNYRYPETIINYLESLIPDNYMRNYMLKFLRRKLDLFEYSPVVLYLLGVSGAGKDTLVSIIERLLGSQCVSRPESKHFLEGYNGWLLDSYFVQLDEYGNQISRLDDKDAALGKLKAYTGKREVNIRTMRTDTYTYMHNATFIMTANKNPLLLDLDDRRMALFNCPNKLADQQWVSEAGGISRVIELIDTEILDFAYYLSTMVDSLPQDEYTEAPDTEDKAMLIASKLNAGEKIAYLFHNGMFTELEKLAREHEVPNFFSGASESRVYEEELYDLYMSMTEDNGTKRGLSVAMKGFSKVPTTRNGQKSYYYVVPRLVRFTPAPEPVEDDELDHDIEGIE